MPAAPDAPVETVLFDIDGTVCEYERDIADLLAIAFEATGVDPFFAPPAYRARFDRFTDQCDSVRDLRERCFVDIARDRGRDPALGRRVARAYADARDHANVRLLDGVRETLAALDERVRLAAVTNGDPAMQSTKLGALDVTAFETVVHAGYDAPAKPAPEPFYRALEAVDGVPDRAVYVGNSLEADVAGAHAAGLRAAWLAREDVQDPTPAPEYVLAELPDLLSLSWV